MRNAPIGMVLAGSSFMVLAGWSINGGQTHTGILKFVFGLSSKVGLTNPQYSGATLLLLFHLSAGAFLRSGGLPQGLRRQRRLISIFIETE